MSDFADHAADHANAGAVVRNYLLPALIVGALIALLVQVQASAEATATGVVSALPIGYAFGAGLVASINPCGFLLLPSYISYHLGTEEAGYYDKPLIHRLLRALLLGVVATAGFVVVFAGAGGIIATGGQWLAGYFPVLGVGAGIAMLAAGVYLLATHRTLMLAAATRASVSPQRNLSNVFLFGVAYAVGSLGCTLPIFFVVMGTAISSRDATQAFLQFSGYALGMGVVLVAVTIGAALFRGAVGRVLRGVVPHVHRLSAFFMVGAGVYLVYYWGFYARSV